MGTGCDLGLLEGAVRTFVVIYGICVVALFLAILFAAFHFIVKFW